MWIYRNITKKAICNCPHIKSHQPSSHESSIEMQMKKVLKDNRAKDQFIGAAISISIRDAEGFEYNRNKHFFRCLELAKGSAGELRSQLFPMMKAEKNECQVYENSCNDLIVFSSEVNGLLNYLGEFEKQRGNQGEINISIF